jgi:phage baseplate assembly protein W
VYCFLNSGILPESSESAAVTIRGIAFPFTIGSTSLPEKADDDDVVADNILRILHTRLGERVMRPEIGSKVLDFVFENTGPVVRARMDFEVRRAISQSEPRATVVNVYTYEEIVAGGDTVVNVEVIYEVQGNLQQVSTSFDRGKVVQ